MTDITSVTSLLPQYDITDKSTDAAAGNDELGQSEFLELMLAQLENQDPLDPQDDAAFIAELAQFSTVEGIEELNASMSDMVSSYKSSTALEASALVGGAVTIDGNSDSTLMWGELVYGMGEIPAGATDVELQIMNSAGETIESVALQNVNGEMTFKWDGANLEVNGELADVDYSKFEIDEDGGLLPHAEGDYSFQVVGNYDNEQMAFDLDVSKRVDSVTILGSNDVELNLLGGDTASMSDIKQINAVF